jgi:hypothetical protein
MHPNRVTGREWRRVWLVILAVTLLTTLPYILAARSGGKDWRFSGFLFGVEDGNSYLGKMRLGARGLWDFYLFYTPEPHDSAPLIFLPYILPGQVVGRLIGPQDPAQTGPLIVTFHLMRVVFNALLIVVLYRFIAVFLKKPGSRLLALTLALFGGGFGWLVSIVFGGSWLGSPPPEFFIPEGFSLLILFGLPHLALARAALLGGLLCLFAALEDRWRYWSVMAGLCWIVVGLAVPFYLVILACILGAWGLAAWSSGRAFPLKLAQAGAVAFGINLPFVAYYALTFSRNPAFAQWSAQNILPSPHPLQYLLAYILLLIPAVFGARWAWRRARRGDVRWALLVGWLVVVPVLVYLPMNVQRRMAEAVIVPLAILATVALEWMARRPATRRVRRALMVAAVFGSAFFLFGATLGGLSPRPPLYYPAAEIRAMDWLNGHTGPEQVILAAYDTGNVIPAYTNQRPYVGHGPETMFAIQKTATMEQFFANGMDAEARKKLYQSVNADYIFYGPVERALANGAPPNWLPDAHLLYDAEGYQIYKLNP